MTCQNNKWSCVLSRRETFEWIRLKITFRLIDLIFLFSFLTTSFPHRMSHMNSTGEITDTSNWFKVRARANIGILKVRKSARRICGNQWESKCWSHPNLNTTNWVGMNYRTRHRCKPKMFEMHTQLIISHIPEHPEKNDNWFEYVNNILEFKLIVYCDWSFHLTNKAYDWR